MKIAYQIDEKSGIPIYIQIMDQIKHLLATGELRPGQQLPTIRELAVELTVNLHTVAHAYAELERDGFLIIRRGRGTFIADSYDGRSLQDVRERKLQALVQNMLAETVNLGYDIEEVEQVLDQQIKNWRKGIQQLAEEETEKV